MHALGHVANPTSSSAAASANTARRDELDQNSFLTLMVAQLRNQDPFKPLDPTEYVGQLAQFSTVSGLQTIENSIGSLVESLRGNQVLSGAGLVGRTVLAEGDTLNLTRAADGTLSASGAVEMPQGVRSAQLVIRDVAGQLVRTQPLEPRAGNLEFDWDGLANNGTRAAAGSYHVEVIASSGGQQASLPVNIAARVTSVAIDPRTNTLLLNTDSLGEMPLAQVRRVM